MIRKIFINRWVHFGFLILILLFLAFGIHPNNEIRERLAFFAFDQYIHVKPRPSADLVKIVDIDDVSLSKLGQWPWSRAVLADMVSRLTGMGARVIAFDGVLAEPDRTSPVLYTKELRQYGIDEEVIETLPDNDQILADAIKRSGIFVSAFTHGSNVRKPKRHKPGGSEIIRSPKKVKDHFLSFAQRFSTTALFLENIEDAAAGNGSFMAKPESDGLIRKTGLIFSDGKYLYPSLNLEAYRIYSGLNKGFGVAHVKPEDNLEYAEYKLGFAGQTIPLDESGTMWVYFRPFDRDHDYISAYEILEQETQGKIAESVNGKILIFGSTAEGLKDLRATAHNAFLPGVELHANVLEQFAQGKYLFRPESFLIYENLFILVVGAVMIVLAPFVNVLWVGVICALSLVMAIGGSWAGFEAQGLLLDPVYPSLSVFLIFVASIFLTYIRTEAERRQVRDAFGLYISRDFMRELTRNPDKLKLGGEIRDLTVMFSDIRRFTTISEGLTPEELIQLMNDFLTPMSDLVMQNRGTIDKYMGDAMMAFWNAPLDDPDHARNACIAALGMQEALAPINEGVAKKALEIGKEPVLLQAGIGINSGPCAVGNMGSRQRFAYSTLGDAVNVASRLEGQTKTYGVGILIGEATYKSVQDFACLEMDLIKVKGKTKPEYIYALLGDEEAAKDEAFHALRLVHNSMIEKYRTGRFEDALSDAKTCMKTQTYNLNVFYDLYIERLSNLIKTPPEGEWDGVFEAQTK